MRINVSIENGGELRKAYPLCAGCLDPITPTDQVEAHDGKLYHIHKIDGKVAGCRAAINPFVDQATGEMVVRSDVEGSPVKPCLLCGSVSEMRVTRLPEKRVRFMFTCQNPACADVDKAEMSALEGAFLFQARVLGVM